MLSGRDQLLADLEAVAFGDRAAPFQTVADLLRNFGHYRWVGLNDVDRAGGVVTNMAWSGSGAPLHPAFPIAKGLTGAAIAGRKTVNVGNVTSDPRYLTAFRTTQSEIIVPVFGRDGDVLGTIDVESENANAFDAHEQALLEACSGVIRPLWQR
jgi:GAF domain-containing protein